MNNPYLEHVLVMLGQVENQTREELSPLSREQLNWRPAPGVWSVAECLDHLIVTDTAYFNRFEAIKEHTLQTGWWARIPGWSPLCGRVLIQAVEPGNGKKLKAFPVFAPSSSDYTRAITDDFLRHQARFTALVHELDTYERHDKILLASPASRWITLRLNDALELLWKHEVRHLAQAIRLKAMDGFPRSANW